VGAPHDGFATAEQRATIERLLRSLSGRERAVLRLYFDEDLTQAEIGRRVGVSQMQVSRIIRQAIGRLREFAAIYEEPVAG
jgi:RNA polymerase sigma-B factor